MLPSGEAHIKDTPDFTALGNHRCQNHFLENYISGTYTVTLHITADGQTYQRIRPAYITVTAPTTTTFPSHGVLDDFNRGNGQLAVWTESTPHFQVVSHSLQADTAGDAMALWSQQAFGGNQEVFVTFDHIDPSAVEQDLLLKAQNHTGYWAGVIEVRYDAPGQRVQVWTYSASQDWVQHGADIPVTLMDGDRLGARATITGMVEVYRNGVQLATRDVTSWPYYADDGYAGLWLIGADETVLDDFGGGSVQNLSSTFPENGALDDFDRADSPLTTWFDNSGVYQVESNHLIPGGGSAYLWWNAQSFGADQEVYVTFEQVDAAANEQDLLLKSQSSTTPYLGVIEVWYDAANQRAQVWTYATEQDWVQHGADIPVTLVDGDQFGARARADGTVEVYRNGVLLATREVTTWPHYANGGYIGLWFINAEDAVLDDFGGGNVPTSSTGPSEPVLALGFNEGSGTTTTDASSNGNTGTLNGATWTTSGKYGNALSFDGVDDWVTVNDAPSLDLVDGMTLEAWVYPTALTSSWRTIMMKDSDAYYYLYADGATGQGPGVGVNISGYKEVYSTSDLPLNTWSHVAGTWDGSTLRLYVNGLPVATLSQSGLLTNSSDPLRIGGNALWGEYFAGRIDEVRVYNRALSPAEIQTDMNTAID